VNNGCEQQFYLLTEQRVSGGSADVCNRRSRTSHDYKCRSFAIVVTSKPLELRSPSAPGAIEPLGFVIEEWIRLHALTWKLSPGATVNTN
jgi:hypothetical protein